MSKLNHRSSSSRQNVFPSKLLYTDYGDMNILSTHREVLKKQNPSSIKSKLIKILLQTCFWCHLQYFLRRVIMRSLPFSDRNLGQYLTTNIEVIISIGEQIKHLTYLKSNFRIALFFLYKPLTSAPKMLSGKGTSSPKTREVM